MLKGFEAIWEKDPFLLSFYCSRKPIYSIYSSSPHFSSPCPPPKKRATQNPFTILITKESGIITFQRKKFINTRQFWLLSTQVKVPNWQYSGTEGLKRSEGGGGEWRRWESVVPIHRRKKRGKVASYSVQNYFFSKNQTKIHCGNYVHGVPILAILLPLEGGIQTSEQKLLIQFVTPQSSEKNKTQNQTDVHPSSFFSKLPLPLTSIPLILSMVCNQEDCDVFRSN